VIEAMLACVSNTKGLVLTDADSNWRV